MLFNSFVFLGVLLPVTLLAFWAAERLRIQSLTTGVLLAASLVYYGYWDYRFLWLICGSILVNYWLALMLQEVRARRRDGATALLSVGIGVNLAPLAYYKYADFALSSVGAVPVDGSLPALILPLGISFFTFQQIAYLVDVRRGVTAERRFLDYALFVTFFPQLIAGPIVHYKETLPQFRRFGTVGLKLSNLAVGLTIFAIGLFKKTVIADGIATVSTPVFLAAGQGSEPDLLQAWSGALAYSFQLYFDFSAYSDMAIGAARMFGVRLPINFHAPYRATSVIDFWRRWHITLSRFLRDYVYIPLGGNRGRFGARYRNMLLTMLIGGLWHGAGWTFVLWGGLHGLFLVANHLWRRITGGLGTGAAARWTGRVLTFLVVVIAWVPFRAEDFDTALRIWSGMAGLNGLILPQSLVGYVGGAPLEALGAELAAIPLRETAAVWGALGALTLWVWTLPTPYMLLRRYRPGLRHDGGEAPNAWIPDGPAAGRLIWRPNMGWALLAAGAGAASVLAMMVGSSEFLYYQF